MRPVRIQKYLLKRLHFVTVNFWPHSSKTPHQYNLCCVIHSRGLYFLHLSILTEECDVVQITRPVPHVSLFSVLGILFKLTHSSKRTITQNAHI